MEKMCFSPSVCDGRENQNDDSVDNITSANTLENFSPGIGSVTYSNKTKFVPNVDDDIPSYQIVHGSKRFSDISEEQESILLISPVSTPPSIKKIENFQVPLVPTIGTIVKNNASVKVSLSGNNDNYLTKESTKKYESAYEVLGMVDNDISWSSSMETPIHNPICLGEYNTLEKATLLPEKDVKNVQPRALFSPHDNDDSECMPLRYSSGSEDEKESNSRKLDGSESYETYMKTKTSGLLKRTIGAENNVIFKMSPNTKLSNASCIQDTGLSPISPVFRISKKNSKTKKQKPLLITSPDTASENDVGISDCKDLDEIVPIKNGDLNLSNEKLATEEENTLESHNGSIKDHGNTFQDDSFQDISITCFNELCNTSVLVDDSNLTDNVNLSPVLKEENYSGNSERLECINKTEMKIVSSKCVFYDTGKTDELHPLTSINSFLKSAEQLEECNAALENKPCQTFNDSELVVFNKMSDMQENGLSGHAVKRLRPISPENSVDPCQKKKKFEYVKEPKALEETNEEKQMDEECMGNYENSVKSISSQCNINVASVCEEQEIDNDGIVSSCGNSTISLGKKSNIDEVHNEKLESNANNISEPVAIFSTALGKPISVSSESRIKALNIFKDEYEENCITTVHKIEDDIPINSFQGFQTASGNAVKISEDSLNKAKNLFLELNAYDSCAGSDDYCAPVGFTTASGMKVNISKDSLKKAKKLLCDMDATDLQKNTGDFKEFIEEGSVGFKLASNEPSKAPEGSLQKTNNPCRELELIPTDNNSIALQKSELNENGSEKNLLVSEASDETSSHKPKSGFKTASGKNLTFSENALAKVRQMLSEEIVDPGTGDTIAENTESIDTICPKESAHISENEKERISIRNNEERDLEDSSELIPPWLHAYRTSPALTMEPMTLGSLVSMEDCNNYCTPTERYFVRSPVLGATDRFFKIEKRRKPGKKLLFNSPKKYLEEEDSNRASSAKKNNPSIKRNLSQLGTNFAIPFKKRKISEDIADTTNSEMEKLCSEVVLERKEARLQQQKAGKKMKVIPVRGSHITKKEQRQMSWNEAVQGAFPEIYSDETLQKYGLKKETLQVTAANAVDYKFRAEDFYATLSCLNNVNGFPVGDDCLLIFDDDNKAGVEEFTMAFFACSGVAPNLISPEWIRNHYKWIVWKLSHYERSFPHVFGGNCLTPHNVMVQLKYRYDREIDGCQRSALKKILERDECSAKRMVLCVSDIKASDLDNKNTEIQFNRSMVPYELGLTDGWYSCYVQIDSAMSRLIEKGKVTIGTKLVTQGAELLNCNDGVSPLEAVEKVHLKIFTNSTRRVKWDTKLGFQKYGGPILVSLNSVLPNGGLVGRLDVVIARIYPILYMEKKSDGTHVVRNRRTEDRAASAYQKEQEAVYEKIYQEVKNEVKNKAKEKEKFLKKVSKSNVSKLTDPEELLKLYEGCSDPSTFQNLLTPEQNQIIIDYQQRKKELANKELSDKVQEKIKAVKMSTRKVSQLLRVKIVDLHKSDYTNAVLFTIWNSTEDVSQILSEGKAISIFNTVPNNSRLHKPIQLNSTRYTQYRELSKLVEYPARKLTHLSELTTLDYEPVFNEIDVVGIVVFIRETSYGSKLSQTVYLADSEFNFIGLVFWGSCKNLGWESILTVSSIVACSNLQWSNRKNFNGIPSVYVNDSSVFKENPKENFLREGIKILKASLPEDLKKFIGKCEDEIIAALDDSKHSNLSRNSSHPYDLSNSLAAPAKPKYINGFKMKPNAWSTPCKSDAFGLDTSDQEPSPIQKRIEKLQLYGEPPPLSPLLPVENLEKFNTKFKAPSRNAVDSSIK